MVKADLKINLLLSGAIVIAIAALASFAFAADPQNDDPTILPKQDTFIMDAANAAAPYFDPKTGSFSTPGFTPVGADSYKELVASGAMSAAAIPPPGSISRNSAAAITPGNMGRLPDSSHMPSISTSGAWAYTPPAPAIAGNPSTITIMLPKSQIILGSDFIKLAPNRFLASALTNVISQIAISSPSINIPGMSATAMPESSLIAVVTPSGIGIYAPANPGINIALPANANMAPSVQIILGSDYMKLAGTGFMAVSVGELQAIAPFTNAISSAAFNSAPSRLPGYAAQMPDSSFITVAITPTAAIYIPGNLNNFVDSPQANNSVALPHSGTMAIMPEIAASTLLRTEDVQNRLPDAKMTPVTQIILGADLITITGDGYISINAGDLKATAPTTNMTQMPDSPFIAVAITPTEAVYMPDTQTITLSKGAINSKADDSISQPPAETLKIVWAVSQKAPETPTSKITEPIKQTEKPAAREKSKIQDANKSTKVVEIKAFISKAAQAIVARSQAFKERQVITAKKLANKLVKQARDITRKTASFVIDRLVAAKRSVSDTSKTIAKYVKFIQSAGNKAAIYWNKFIKGLIQVFKVLELKEEAPVFILDRNTLPLAAMDRQNDPFGPPLPKFQVKDLTGDTALFGSFISAAIPNRIMNANMFFVDIIKKNAVNYARTGLSPPQTVSFNSTALLSASKESVFTDSAFVIPARFADFSVFFIHILNKTVSPSLLNAYAFNFKAGDFYIYKNLFNKGGSYV